MNKEEKSIFDGYQDGEHRILGVVRQMLGDEPIHSLEIIKRHPDPAPMIPIGPLEVNLYDTESFVNFCKRYGNKDTSRIFYDDEYVKIILNAFDEQAQEGRYDVAWLNFRFSPEFEQWDSIVNRADCYSQKDIIEFLRRNMDDILNGEEVLLSYEHLKTCIHVEIDSSLSSKDGRVLGVKFTSKTDNKINPGKLIVLFQINIPVLQNDIEARPFTIQVDLQEPESDKDQATFLLRSRTFIKAQQLAIADEVEKIKHSLKEWDIFYGIQHSGC